MKFKPLDKSRFSEQIAQLLQQRIYEETLAAGERLLSEKDMAEEFQVSRTVVREAMRILEGRGLITIKKGPHGGIFVTHGFHKPLSDSLKGLVASGQVAVDHIFEFRLLLGPHVAYEAARRANKEDVEALEALLDKAENNLDDALALRTNRGQFHLRMTKALGNPVLEMVMKSLIELIRAYFHGFQDLNFEKWAITIQRRIVRAIAERRPDEARRLMTTYLEDLKRLLQEWAKSQD